MTVDQKREELVKQLLAATKNHEIQWTDTASENAFRAVLAKGMVRIEEESYHDEDGHPNCIYKVTILNKDGKIVEEYSPRAVAGGSLFEEARRSARKTEKILDDLLEEIGSKK